MRVHSALHRLGDKRGLAGACQHPARGLPEERHERPAHEAVGTDDPDEARIPHG
jgi:hypothetical protein